MDFGSRRRLAGSTEISTGYVSYNIGQSSGRVRGQGGMFYTCPTTTYSNFVYHDTFGTNHYFPVITQLQTTSSPCNGTSTPNGSAVSNDGAGYTISITYFNEVVLTARDGHTFIAPSNATTGSGSISDLNGNQVTTNGSGAYTDTSGKTAMTVSAPSSSQQQFTYTDANGNAQNVTANYTAYTVQTAFGCAGVSEYGPQSVQLISSISLPDGSSYQLHYESTPGVSGAVTGRLAGLQLPQGGTIGYQYTGANNGINCADGSAAGLTRTIAGGTRTYSRSQITATSSQTQTTDGLNNVTISNFVFAGTPLAPYETQRQVYTGAASGTALLNRQTCYNAATVPCTTTAVTLPISQIDTYQLADGIQENGSTFKYNAYGLKTEQDDYDYGGSTSRGSLLRKEVWTYPTSGVVSLLASDEVFDGNGNEAGLSTYKYDEGTVTATSGLPQHGGSIGPQRGNLTSGLQYFSASGTVAFSNTYEDTGNVLTSTDPNGTSQYTYEASFHAFPLSATPPTPSSNVSLPSGTAYDPVTGVLLSTSDPNSQSVLYKSYDALLRPGEIDYPDGGKSTFTYSFSPAQVGVHLYQSANVYTDVEQRLDTYGRPSRLALSNGQATNPYYQQDTCYDAAGHSNFTSTLYQGPGFSAAAVCSQTGTTVSYDGLGRKVSITNADGSKTFVNKGRATQYTDENGVKRVTQVDALGRISAVCEISSNSLSGGASPAACGLDIAGTGYLTSYAYALATGTTTVTQGAQTRTFQTDWLGRTTSVREPESGLTTYTYAYNATGLLVTRSRPKANQTSASTLTTSATQYDTVGRAISVTYSDNTPPKYFQYDIASTWPEANQQTYVKGRLGQVARPGSSVNSASIYGYDPMGRVVQQYSCTPTSCGNPSYDRPVGYSYNWAGMLTSEGDGAGDTYTYGRSLAGELTAITSSFSDAKDPANILVPGSVTNGVFGPTGYQLGNGLQAIYTYDSLGRNNGGWFCNGSTQAYCTGGSQLYGYSTQYSGKRVTVGCDTVLNACNQFGYDEFNRLATKTINGGSGANLSFSYDQYGNRWNQTVTAGSVPSPSLSFSAATNQIQMAGYSYDALGNLTNDGFHSYTYDADNNLVAVDNGSTATYYYDALNHRTEVARSGSAGSYEFVFDATGRRVSTWVAGTHAFSQALIYSDTKPVAFRSGGATHFQHQDYLGTARANTGYAGAVEGTFASLPFGDNYVATGSDSDWYHYGGTDHDAESSTEHATYRQLSTTQGHWMSPDPYAGSYRLVNLYMHRERLAVLG